MLIHRTLPPRHAELHSISFEFYFTHAGRVGGVRVCVCVCVMAVACHRSGFGSKLFDLESPFRAYSDQFFGPIFSDLNSLGVFPPWLHHGISELTSTVIVPFLTQVGSSKDWRSECPWALLALGWTPIRVQNGPREFSSTKHFSLEFLHISGSVISCHLGLVDDLLSDFILFSMKPIHHLANQQGLPDGWLVWILP